MEVVRVFNNELSSLYEVKPPISKAKMTQITKSAIKGIKFYKHIVQSVEKFIQKCRPEYKVPGLYVVDSIVRQSRHQFGSEKDVFGPRFVKNITITFQNLFKCSEDDRPKIIRVLNLWQKNSVFPIEVIQPLLDMGHPNTSNEWSADNTSTDIPKESPVKIKEEARHKSSESWKGWPQSGEEPIHDDKPYAEISAKNLEKFNKVEMSNAVKEEEMSRSLAYKNQVKVEKAPEETVKFNKKLLDFDYGDEDDEEMKNEESHLSIQPNALALSMAQNFLNNPDLLRQIEMAASTSEQLIKEMAAQSHQPKSEDMETNYSQDMQSSPQVPLIPPTTFQQPLSHNMHLSQRESDTDDRVLPEPPLPPRDLDERSLASVMASHERLLPSMCLPAFQQTGVTAKPPLPDKDDRIIPDPSIMPPQDLDERSLASIIAPPDRTVMPPIPYPENASLLQFQFDKNGVPYQTQPSMPMMESLNMDTGYPPVIQSDQHLMQNSQADADERVMYSMPGEPPLPPQDFDERQIILPEPEKSRKERSRSRSGSRSRGRSNRHRSRSRSPRRKRSRSRSRSRKNRSRSRERERERIREKEREREREKERRRKGIPPIKKGCASVCSTTLWLGHVPKSCSEVDISNTFGQYGTILSIDMIPPRGCAYVVMDRRQDGHKILQRCKNVKLQGSSIKMAWAPGKGVKGKEFKDYWEVELGVSYVPYDKIKEDPEALDLLEEGGFIDEDSLPEHLKALRKPDEEKQLYNATNKGVAETNAAFPDIQSAPNMVPPPIMPPTSVNIPVVLPHMMQPQFGLHLPGMLPPQAMMMQVPMGIPPPAPMLMVQQQSQGILSNQPLSVVGGVPQIVPRTIPPATTTLPNLKSAVQTESVLSSTAIAASTAIGDATPTEEEGTNVLSPSVQISVPGTVSVPAVPAQSTQPVVSVAQFNTMLGLNANRPMLSVPPPVSTTGTPIPYPPPNMGFNFPPPGIRPPGQAHTLPPNPQFPWMQKQVGSPFADGDSSQSTTSIRPVPPPQPGMSVHMFGSRPPFHDPQSTISNINSTPIKESLKGRDSMEPKSGDMESAINRNVSPGHHDKMIQEMVISTDDESSMDVEYPRNDIPTGPCYPGVPEFPRTPMNMQRMRGPPGQMPPGPRFRGMPMGSPFPMRMGGPRGMGGPGMHNRMDMEFPPHHGSRGPRIPMGPHGPRRNDMHAPHDGREWYPRDFEGPPYDRERDRRYRDDWNRESWEHERDSRHNSRDHDEGRRDDHRESWNRERSDNSRSSKDVNIPSDKNNDSSGKPKDKPNKSKATKSLMDDLLKLRSYQRGGPVYSKPNRSETSKDKIPSKDDKVDSNDAHKLESNIEQSNNDKDDKNEQIVTVKKEKDRESRKRSRWGRTLSEEREIQQQKRNEIELKFQSYEQSHAAQQPVQTSSITPIENSDEISREQSEGGVIDTPLPDTNIPMQNNVDIAMQNEVHMLTQTASELPVQNELHIPTQTSSELSIQNELHIPIQTAPELPVQNEINMPTQTASELPVQNEVHMPTQTAPELSVQNEVQTSIHTDLESSMQNEVHMPVQTASDPLVQNEVTASDPLVQNEMYIPVQTTPEIPVQNELHMPVQTTSELPLQNEVHMPLQTTSELPVLNEQPLVQDDCEMPIQNSSELNVVDDLNIAAYSCTDAPQSESSKLCDVVDNVCSGTSVTESNTTTLCTESVDDLSMNNVTDSTSNENNTVTDDVITNNSSLVSTES